MKQGMQRKVMAGIVDKKQGMVQRIEEQEDRVRKREDEGTQRKAMAGIVDEEQGMVQRIEEREKQDMEQDMNRVRMTKWKNTQTPEEREEAEEWKVRRGVVEMGGEWERLRR